MTITYEVSVSHSHLCYTRSMSLAFGPILKHWREVRRFSQLALSHESGFSSRHISFLETGRSNPSRGSILALARVLDMPKTATNNALLAAGFSPEFPDIEPHHDDMAPVQDAIATIMNNHAPMPAIAIDPAWNIVSGNVPAQSLLTALPFQGSLSIIDALINDDPDNPQFVNWLDVASWTALRLQAELGRRGEDTALRQTYDRLMADPRLKTTDTKSFSNYGPVLTSQIRIGDTLLTLFTMMAEFSTVQDITLSERRIELFFPADVQTREFFETLSA